MTEVQVRVRYWGAIASQMHREVETVRFPSPPDARAFLDRIIEEAGEEGKATLRQPGILLAVNGRSVGWGHRLADGDAVDVLPAAAGG